MLLALFGRGGVRPLMGPVALRVHEYHLAGVHVVHRAHDFDLAGGFHLTKDGALFSYSVQVESRAWL